MLYINYETSVTLKTYPLIMFAAHIPAEYSKLSFGLLKPAGQIITSTEQKTT